MSVSVTFKGVVKRFGGFTALHGIDLVIAPGELFFLLGPSGCGKTTLLRCLAGFYQPEAGTILLGDRDITRLPPYKRDTGMMFQSYALWPHMTLAENVAFGLEMRHVSKAERATRVARALDMVHLGDRANQRPNQLSGGQQQRVALARALVIQPQCLLLDEPLSNLDAKLRLEMRMEIRSMCKEFGLTAVYVTHDQKEALSVADRLAVMRAGVIEQIGAPDIVYRNPANAFVAGFIGEANFIRGTLAARTDDTVTLATPLGTICARGVQLACGVGDAVSVCFRPEVIRVDTPAPDANVFDGVYRESVYLGEVAQHVLVCADGITLRASELNPRGGRIASDTPARAWVAPEHVIVVPATE